FYHPSGRYLIFASNLLGFANFELFVVDVEGQREPVRITHTDGFDGLPAFSPDGNTLSWTSNRTGDEKSQIFLASWNHEAAMNSLALTGSLDGPAPSELPDPAALAEAIEASDLKQHIDYLASEKLGGRMTGTPGEILATDYVAGAFKTYGLEPFLADSYFQTFPFTAGVKLGEDNQLTITGSQEGKLSSEVETDWIPLSFSTTGDVKAAKIVFAGYGMEVPEGEGSEIYSSYAHLDVEGKWVLLFRYMPEQITPERRQELARFSSLRYKALVARQKGALGILVASGPNAQVKRQLIPLTFDASLAGSGIPAISISDAIAETLLKPTGKSLKELQDKLDTGDLMAGIQIEGIEVGATISIDHENREGRNVVGRLRASDPPDGKALAPLLIGAHVDHLGSTAGANSRAVDNEASNIHYGADDNASGVAGMLEIAQYLSARQKAGKLKLKRDVLFAAWSGEELGLLGSAYFARQLAGSEGDENAPLTDHLTACLNMDMIGRLDKSLVLQGIGSSDYWKPEIEKRNAPIGLPLTLQTDSYISTDATSFFLKEVPILNAFTGAHEEYHTPRDTPDKINFEGAESITRFMG
ncbi:MAG: M28 family peptidase, partial [Verrucomicrobiota bacterium]